MVTTAECLSANEGSIPFIPVSLSSELAFERAFGELREW